MTDARSPYWQLPSGPVHFGRLPLLMGILNVTPDSFSDGGAFFEMDAAVQRGLRMASSGAAFLDVGGESTRPYATPVEADEERRRVEGVVRRLADQTQVPISIDTSKAFVAEAALDAGAQIINDVTGLEGDADMIHVARRTGAAVCIMHMQGTPQTMQDAPHYDDVVTDIQDYLGRRRDALEAAGISRDRICLDPGIGFGKTTSHNLALLRAARALHGLGCPLLVGHSRKGFIGRVAGDRQADPLGGTIGVALALARQGVQVIRVHDVEAVQQALRLFEECGGLDG